MIRLNRQLVAIEGLETRRLMADFSMTRLTLRDEDLLLNPTPSIRINSTLGDSIHPWIDFTTSAVPQSPRVVYRFTSLGQVLAYTEATDETRWDGTGTWSLYVNRWSTTTVGSYQATAEIDATNLVAETNETNNAATISYNAVAAPEIRLFGTALNKIVDDQRTTGQRPTSIADGTDFGFITAGSPPVDRTFTVTNVGVLPLSTADLVVPSGFSIVEGLSPSIPSNGTDTFTLRALTSQPINGSVTFTTNDLNEGSFKFTVQANIPRPTAISTTLDTSATPPRVLVGFNTNVGATVSTGDFKIINIATGATVPSTTTYNASTNVATVKFTTAPANGRYRLTSEGTITDVYSNPLESPISYDFSYIRADIDGDGTVGFSDLLIIAQNYGQSGRTFAQGNINYSSDGKVDFDDLLLLSQQYGTSLITDAPKPSTRIAADILK